MDIFSLLFLQIEEECPFFLYFLSSCRLKKNVPFFFWIFSLFLQIEDQAIMRKSLAHPVSSGLSPTLNNSIPTCGGEAALLCWNCKRILCKSILCKSVLCKRILCIVFCAQYSVQKYSVQMQCKYNLNSANTVALYIVKCTDHRILNLEQCKLTPSWFCRQNLHQTSPIYHLSFSPLYSRNLFNKVILMPETLYVFLSYKYLGINLFTPMYNIHCIFKIVNIHFIFLSSYDRQTCVEPCSRVSIIPAAHLCPVVIITHSQLYMFHQQSLVKVPSSQQSVEQQQLSQLDPFFACSDFVLS